MIVMPTTTPLIKVNRTRNYGAEVVLYGNDFDEACEHAYKLAEEHGYTFVHPFDDLAVATGQGSIAMEIIKELPTVDYAGGRGRPLRRRVHLGQMAEPEDPGDRRGAGRRQLPAGFPAGRKSGGPAFGQHHCRRHRGAQAGGKAVPLPAGKCGPGYNH